jgi:Na+/melibiose symporter-like transporter
METFDFEEEQRFTSWWMWLLMGLGLLMPLLVVVYSLINKDSEGFDKKETVLLLAVFLIYNLPILLLVFYARLRTKINELGIYYGWNIPTKELNFIAWQDLESCELVQHKFVGYGYKLTKAYGMVYNCSGKHGLWLIKKSGEKILVGTMKVEEMNACLLKLNDR